MSRANGVARKILKSHALENIEHTLADRDQTEGGPWEKNRANERLITQRRERAHLEVTDFGDELIENLSFGFDITPQKPKPPKIVEGSFA
jgi:hypothetical protein